MLLIRRRACARAGLLGNPSDGYHGKTISIIVRNFWAEVVLYEWDSVDIVLAENDRARFSSVDDLARDVRLHGYYGGIRLIKATIKRFVEHCEARGLKLHGRNFSVRYQTTIPRQVGLAGSSAIIVATLRCLMDFYNVRIPLEAQPTFVLRVEQEELGIAAGLQDRVIQVYEGMVYMDFDLGREHEVEGLPCYEYERLDPALLPPLYLAYHDDLSEPTEVFHNNIRERFNRGDEQVVGADPERAHRAVERQQARPVDVEPVDLAHLGPRRRPADRVALDVLGEPLALAAVELLRVVDAARAVVAGQDARPRDDGACERRHPRLVHARDVDDAAVPQLALVAEQAPEPLPLGPVLLPALADEPQHLARPRAPVRLERGLEVPGERAVPVEEARAELGDGEAGEVLGAHRGRV